MFGNSALQRMDLLNVGCEQCLRFMLLRLEGAERGKVDDDNDAEWLLGLFG